MPRKKQWKIELTFGLTSPADEQTSRDGAKVLWLDHYRDEHEHIQAKDVR